MQLYIKKKIGKETYTFTVEGNNLFELVQESQKLSFGNIDKCGCEGCNSENLILNSRIAGAKKFKYVEIKCLSCKGAAVFGNMTEHPDTYYLRRNKETKKYDWKEYNPSDTDSDTK